MSSIHFTAQWSKENYHLQKNFYDIINSPFRTRVQVVSDCTKRALCLAAETLLSPIRNKFSYWIMPANRSTPEQLEKPWKPAATKVCLTSPDGEDLPPSPWFVIDGQKDLPTVIVLSPFIPKTAERRNDIAILALDEDVDWMIKEARLRYCNLLFLDARRPSCSFEDQVLDASAAVEFLRNQGVGNISVFGFCTGGVVAAYVSQMYKVTAVVYNSYTSFGAFLRNSRYMAASVRERVPCPYPVQCLATLFASLVGWSPTMPPEARVIALQNTQDELIPKVARIPTATRLWNTTPIPPHRGHWAPLTQCIDFLRNPGSSLVFDMLLGQGNVHCT